MNTVRILDRVTRELQAKARALTVAGQASGATEAETQGIKDSGRLLSLALLFTAESIILALKAEQAAVSVDGLSAASGSPPDASRVEGETT